MGQCRGRFVLGMVCHVAVEHFHQGFTPAAMWLQPSVATEKFIFSRGRPHEFLTIIEFDSPPLQ
jgi:hypothetical protein